MLTGDRVLARLAARLEAPGFHGPDGNFVEAKARRADHAKVLGHAVLVHYQGQFDRGVYARPARLFAVRRL
jgi:hypothetical protein